MTFSKKELYATFTRVKKVSGVIFGKCEMVDDLPEVLQCVPLCELKMV